jgi:trans-aconitate methyltransferase
VPLHKEYAFEDMEYLDTIEAYPMFEIQADIIIQKQCKGIVDVGCRHGPVVEILHKKGYTDFKYMGFDTSNEPIAIAQDRWSNYSNIEFRHGSWDNADILAVDFSVDQVIWSGVLLYRPDDHFNFFNKITHNLYNSPNAIIQEPMPTQRHWRDDLVLNRISDDMEQYRNTYREFKEHKLDLEIFAGRRLIVDVTL